MNASDLWPAIARIEAAYSLQLTQALIHFLWQGCAIAAVYAAAMFALRRSTAAARHLAGAAALLLMAACLPITLCLLPSQQTDETKLARTDVSRTEIPFAQDALVENATEDAAFPLVPNIQHTEIHTPVAAATSQPEKSTFAELLLRLSPYASAVYLFGVLLMLVRVSLGVWGVGRLRRICTPVADDAMLQLVRDCARRMALRAVPVVAYCRRISTPMAVGILRPMILLPAALASGLTPQQLQSILLHEMAHLRRYDLLINVLQRLVEAMLFFHPAVWWISRRVSIERENACDDLATLAGEERVQYADALLRAAELCAAARSIDARRAASLAATGENASQFGDRLRRLLGQKDRPKFRLTVAGAAVSVLLVVALLLMPTILRGAGGACDKVKDEQPTTMSADEFMQLTTTEQRDMLVSVFQHRLKQADNLYFHTEQIGKVRKNNNGIPGEPIDGKPDSRWVYRHWRLNDSCRMVTESFQKPDDAEPNYRSSYGVNADEGLARCLTILREGGKNPPSGQVLYPQNPDNNNLYIYWLDRKFPQPKEFVSSTGEPLFQSLLRHKDEFKIEPAGELIRLSVPRQPRWAEKPSGTQVCLLDPQKGFLPVKCDSRWDEKTQDGKPLWGEESLAVKECRLVGDVWMPVKISTRSEIFFAPEEISICEINVLQIEHGKVKPDDLMVPFSEGMQIRDTVEGISYTSDAQGKPIGRYIAYRKMNPPDWWIKRYGKVKRGAGGYSLASRLSPKDQNALDAANDQMERDKLERRKTLEALSKKLKSLPPEDVNKRIDVAMEILRTGHFGLSGEIWVGAIRELILLGKPAVPRLIEELDRCNGDDTMRALGFVLRGISDPRSIPALIRALPRSFESHTASSHTIKDDPELLQFMLKHNYKNIAGGRRFLLGTPISEITASLEKLTGQTFDGQEWECVHVMGGSQQRRVIQTQILVLTRRWANWWKNNWQKHLDDEVEAQLDVIEKSLHKYADSIPKASVKSTRYEFPRGPNVVMDGGISGDFRSFIRSPSTSFWDIDSGRRPVPPKNLLEESTDGMPSKNLLVWAKREGVDLIVVGHKSSDGKKPYPAFMPLGMKVWRVDAARLDGPLDKLRKDGELNLPEPWKGLIAQTDPKTGEFNELQPAMYLFITAEGVCGVIRLDDGGMFYSFFFERDKAEHHEKLETLLKKLKSLPSEDVDERIETALEILRNHKVTENTPIWAYAIRELITIGKPAVPRLIDELDQCKENKTTKALGFVLRGIGDPRAVPALIRVIPRMIGPSGCNTLTIREDIELSRFMRAHEVDYFFQENAGKGGTNKGKIIVSHICPSSVLSPAGSGSPYFSYGDTSTEILSALEKLTGQSLGWQEYRHVYLKGGVRQRRVIQRQVLTLAQRWNNWWNNNWGKFLDDESEAQFDLIEQTLRKFADSIPEVSNLQPRSGFPHGPNVLEVNNIYPESVYSSFCHPSADFSDIDSGRLPMAPKSLLDKSTDGEPSPGLLAWAEREGVDLIVVKHKVLDDKKSAVAFKAVGMKVWRIDNNRFNGLLDELRKGDKFDLPEPWEGLIARIDSQTGEINNDRTASFGFITTEGVCGAIQLADDKVRWKFFYERDEGK